MITCYAYHASAKPLPLGVTLEGALDLGLPTQTAIPLSHRFDRRRK